MAFKMAYNKNNFPFKKNTNADEVLVEGQKDATPTIFGKGEQAKVDMFTGASKSLATLAGGGVGSNNDEDEEEEENVV